MAILSNMFYSIYSLPYSLYYDGHNCMSLCQDKYKQSNITQYIQCIDDYCTNDGKYCTIAVIVLCVIISGLSYELYTTRRTNTNTDTHYYNIRSKT